MNLDQYKLENIQSMYPFEAYMQNCEKHGTAVILMLLVSVGLFAFFSYLAGKRANTRLLPRLLILASLVIVPLIFYQFNWRHYYMVKMLTLRFFACCLFAVYLVSLKWRMPVRNPLRIPLLLLFAAWTISSLRAPNMAESMEMLMDFTTYFIFMVVCFRYVRSIKFMRLAIILSCTTQVFISIFGMQQISRKLPTSFVFTYDQAVSTIGNVNYCAYYLDIIVPLALGMLIYSMVRDRRAWMYILFATVEVAIFNMAFFKMGKVTEFIGITLLFYGLLSVIQWACIIIADKDESHSLSAFLSTKLYTYSALFGLLHLYVIESRGSHVGVLLCIVTMIGTWAYFRGGPNLTNLFRSKEKLFGTAKFDAFNRRITTWLLALLGGFVFLVPFTLLIARKIDVGYGNRWLTRTELSALVPQWVLRYYPTLFYLLCLGLVIFAILLGWALITWVLKRPNSGSQEPGDKVETEEDKRFSLYWMASFGAAIFAGVLILLSTFYYNGKVTDLISEEGYTLGQTTKEGVKVALPKSLDLWKVVKATSVDSNGNELVLTEEENSLVREENSLARRKKFAIGIAMLASFVVIILLITAWWPSRYSEERTLLSQKCLMFAGVAMALALAAMTTILLPYALAYFIAALILLAAFCMVIYNAIRHVSQRAASRHQTSHWMAMTALTAVLPIFILATSVIFHNPTILNIWRGNLKEFKNTDLNTILFRFEVWKSCSRMIFDCDARGVMDVSNNNTLLGIGAGNFKVMHPLFTALRENRVLGKEVLARKTHSFYFHVASEAGIIGVFAMFWLFLATLWIMLKFLNWSAMHIRRARLAPEHKRNPKVIAQYSFLFYLMWGLLGGFVTTLGHCIFEANWIQPASAATLWFLLAAVAGMSQACWRKEREALVVESPRQKYLDTEEPYTEREMIQGVNQPQDFFSIDHLREQANPIVAVLAIAGFVILVATFHTQARHFVAENNLKWGMVFHDYKSQGGREIPYTQPNCRPRFYNHMFHCFDQAKALWPQQMEIYYILGRYHIDIANDIDEVMNIQDRKQYKGIIDQLAFFGLDLSSKPPQKVREEYLFEGAKTLLLDLYMNPNYKWGHNNFGVTLDRLGMTNPQAAIVARQSYKKALDIDTEQIYALFNLAIGLFKQAAREGLTLEEQRELLNESVRYFERASEVDPTKPEVFFYLSKAYYGVGNPQASNKALLHYADLLVKSKGIRRDQQVAMDMMRASQLVLATTPMKAVQYSQAAAMAAPQDTRTLDNLGLIYIRLGAFSEAEKIYKQAVSVKPRDGSLFYRLASCQAQQEKNSEAIINLGKAFRMKPGLKASFTSDPAFKAQQKMGPFKRLLEK
jgi:tetratricopeptide (TPR) repeat protein